jgi:hypothetical protein
LVLFNGYQPRGRKGYYDSDPTLIERLEVVVKSRICFERVGDIEVVTRSVKVMLRFCLVDVLLLVAFLLPLSLSYPKKESWQAQGRNQKPIWIPHEFIY